MGRTPGAEADTSGCSAADDAWSGPFSCWWDPLMGIRGSGNTRFHDTPPIGHSGRSRNTRFPAAPLRSHLSHGGPGTPGSRLPPMPEARREASPKLNWAPATDIPGRPRKLRRSTLGPETIDHPHITWETPQEDGDREPNLIFFYFWKQILNWIRYIWIRKFSLRRVYAIRCEFDVPN